MNGKYSFVPNRLLIENRRAIALKSTCSKSIKTVVVLFSVLFTFSSISQTPIGPAGVNSNIKLWLDASDLDGDGIVEGVQEQGYNPVDLSITQWRDKSGAITDPTHFVNPVPGGVFNDTPRYRLLEPNFNNRTTVDFGASSALIQDFTGTWTGAQTVFIVFRQKATSVPIGTSLFASGINDAASAAIDEHFQISSDSTAGTHLAYYTTTNSGGTPVSSTENNFGLQTTAEGAVTFYTVTRNTSNSVLTYENGVLSNTIAFSADGNVFDQYVLNANRDTSLTNNCYIAEVIVYNRVLSAAERIRIQDYLDCKYTTGTVAASPGGIQPCDLSVWFKADAQVAYSGTTPFDVDGWTDQGNYNFSGTTTSGNKPTYVIGNNNFNPSLGFNGSNERISLGSVTPISASDEMMIGTSAFRIYAVAASDNSNGTLFADVLCDNSTGNGYTLGFQSSNWSFSAGSFTSAPDVATAEVTSTSTEYALLNVRRSGTSHILQTNEGIKDTAFTATPVSYSTSSTFSERWIGRRGTCSGASHFGGRLSELILVRSSVTVGEDRRIQSYLGLKYGLTLHRQTVGSYRASDGVKILWDNIGYWNDVAGIGQDAGSSLNQRISTSQHPTSIVTIAHGTTTDFTSPNDAPRPDLGDGNFLVWGNNNIPASDPWLTTAVPDSFVVSPQRWLVKETGAVGAVSLQVNVNDPQNDMPLFYGSLYFVHGTNLSTATPMVMTEMPSGSGNWVITGVDFGPNDYFSFAVKNNYKVEFTSGTSSTVNETNLGPFTSIQEMGILNVASSYRIRALPSSSATNGSVDFNYVTDTIFIAPGNYSTVSTGPLNPLPVLFGDTDIEGNEIATFAIVPQFGVYVADVDGGGFVYGEHDLIIIDDDSYLVSIVKLTDGTEGSTDATFDIVLASAASIDITGNIAWSGTASGSDYINTTTTFTIPATQLSIPVPINLGTAGLDDNLLEGTETIIGTISGLTTGAVASVPSDTANLFDDEMTGIHVEIDTVPGFGTALEGSGTFRYRISLENGVQNNSGSSIDGTINFSGSASSGDYNSISTFSIPNGAYSTTINYSALSDVIVEATESVIATITLTNGIGTTVTATDNATAYILDEDAGVLTVSITVVGGGSGVTEGTSTTIDYNIAMDNGKINGTGADISGPVTFTGTALEGVTEDYTLPFTDFFIPNGSSSTIFTVNIVDDTANESTENLTATLTTMTYGTPNATSSSVLQQIFDNDSPGIAISIGSPVSVTEGDGQDITFTVSIVNGGTSTVPISGTVTYAPAALGIAESGVDFTPDVSFTIPAFATSDIITIPVTNDFAAEPTEAVIATLSGTPTSGSYNNTNSTAYITDDDATNLSISIDTVSMSGTAVEGISNISFVVSLEMNAVNTTGSDIYGSITFSGTADTGLDYNSPSGNWGIANGLSTDTITLTVEQDLFIEYTESITATISGQSIGSIATSSSTAYIIDDDMDNISITLSAPVNGHEDPMNPASFTVSLENGLFNGLGEDLTGTVTYSGGTADPGLDFTNVTLFAIPSGQAFDILSIDIADDQNLEVQESIVAIISDLLIPGSVNLTANTDTAYIQDNDLGVGQLVITKILDGNEVPMTTVNPLFRVSIVGGGINQTNGPVTGDIALTGTAINTVDYTIPSLSFEIPVDSTSVLINLTIIDDPLEEPTETVIATISNPNQGLTITIPNSTATAEIFDGDTDSDNDGLPDIYDSNDDNIDSDCDGIYDGCDYDPYGDSTYLNGTDADGDGINDACDADTNNDGTIDNGPDENNDGLNDLVWDPTDDDGDFLPNHVDPDPTNEDTDGDGTTDGADVDANGDGINDHGCDEDDDQVHDQADKDYIENTGNPDDDGDGIINSWDMTPVELDGQAINYIVSPNNDNVNETLRIPGIQVFPNHQLIIYNRWGTQIYESTDYKNNWAGEIQGGIVIGDGQEIIEGTYFYTLDLGEGGEYVRGYIEVRK